MAEDARVPGQAPGPFSLTYRTVFEAGITTCPVWAPAFGLVFVVTGIALVKRYRRGAHGYLGWAILGFAAVWTATASLGLGAQCHRCARGLTPETTRVVEGPVRDFVPMPYTGHRLERFTVNGVRFAYSDFEVTCGFNNTASHGGPLGAGLPVRIHYDGNLILKLEIAR